MQDPMKHPQFPEQEQLKCPRCESPNTKFCYYNNYNLSQPRHFCKNCKRYWTKGGALRNIPVGGGSRKATKRSSSSSSSSSAPKRSTSASSPTVSGSSLAAGAGAGREPVPQLDPTLVYAPKADLDISGSFKELLGSNGQFGSLLEGMNSNESGLKLMEMGDFGRDLGNSGHGLGSDPGLEARGNVGDPDGYMGLQNGDSASCWSGGGSNNGWPDLAIYTPGSSFQ